MTGEPRRHLGAIIPVVRDYDEARNFYVEKLGFRVVEDTPLGGGYRWDPLQPAGR